MNVGELIDYLKDVDPSFQVDISKIAVIHVEEDVAPDGQLVAMLHLPLVGLARSDSQQEIVFITHTDNTMTLEENLNYYTETFGADSVERLIKEN